jgi:hypothetical protein
MPINPLGPARIGFKRHSAQITVQMDIPLRSGKFRLVREFAFNPGSRRWRVSVVPLKSVWLHRHSPNTSFQMDGRKAAWP